MGTKSPLSSEIRHGGSAFMRPDDALTKVKF
jgi:hypothetical protein